MNHPEDIQPENPATGPELSGRCSDDNRTAARAARPLAQAALIEEGPTRDTGELGIAAAADLEAETRRLRAESEAALAELSDAAGRYVQGQSYFQPPHRVS